MLGRLKLSTLKPTLPMSLSMRPAFRTQSLEGEACADLVSDRLRAGESPRERLKSIAPQPRREGGPSTTGTVPPLFVRMKI